MSQQRSAGDDLEAGRLTADFGCCLARRRVQAQEITVELFSAVPSRPSRMRSGGKRRVPEEVRFQTKPEIALDQIRAAVAEKVARGVVLADAAYGINTEFRDGLTEFGLEYVVGVQSSMTVWEPGKQPLPAKPRGKM